jgi:transposase
MAVKEIRRATRKHYSAEEEIRIVLDGLRGEDSPGEDGANGILNMIGHSRNWRTAEPD